MGKRIQWTPELEDAICRAIAITPKGLESICKAHSEFPCADEVYEHLHGSDPFRQKYLGAKAAQVLRLADEIIEIADDARADMMEIETEGGAVVKKLDREHFERVRLRIDSRKWLAGKLAPKVFGDKLTHSGDAENPPVFVVKSILDKE